MNNSPAAAESYEQFLATKGPKVEPNGFEPGPLHESLYPFQIDIVTWAVRRGQAAIFADCGMGKTRMQLEWARLVQEHTGGRVLIVAPIAVAEQTIAEGRELGMNIERVQEAAELLLTRARIVITNYERLHRFIDAPLEGIVLDESSILKSLDGKTRTLLLQKFSGIPYRLCCTATPAPNDVSELANHAEFLGAMSRVEMLATFFVHDSDNGEWRLKGHAAGDMWRWMTQWAVFVRRPSDLGYEDGGWQLPPLSITDEVVPTGLQIDLGGIGGRIKARRATLEARVKHAAELIRRSPGQWLVWVGLNDEGRELQKALTAKCEGDNCGYPCPKCGYEYTNSHDVPDCAEYGGKHECICAVSAALIEGQDSEADKVERERAWRAGEVRVLITKPEIFGFGMNWQHCSQQLFLGLGDSYEKYYQAIRRSWRFGQQHPVDVRIVVSDVEGAISQNVKRKEEEAKQMAESIVAASREGAAAVRTQRHDTYEPKIASGEKWDLLLGDCVERVKEVPDKTAGLIIYSPPFASLYTYSSSTRDMGNCRSYEEFFGHYRFLLPELLRVLMPGRRIAVHCQQLSTTKNTHGYIGLRDFRGDLIRAHTAAGFIYDGEICIDKNPQAQAIRTKSKQLMFVQKNKDSSWNRPALADYILLFRHPEENPETPVKTDVSNEEWILFAHPIWYGIRESNVLKTYRDAREDEDEKHICPLQLETIERCIRLWSNPGDVILSPFAGIGSEGYVSLRFGRQFIGCELKESYWRIAQENLQLAEREGPQQPTVAVDTPEPKQSRAA